MTDRKESVKPDLRDSMYPPLSVTDVERKYPLDETPASINDEPIVTPDPTKVPEGQTTKQ